MLKLLIKKRQRGIIFVIVFFFSLNIFFTTSNAEDNKRPDLVIYSVEWESYGAKNPYTLKEGVEVNFTIKIQNVGTKNITADEDNPRPINVGLLIDYNLVSTKSKSKGLNINEICYANLSWTPDIGDGKKHVLSIEVKYNSTNPEGNYNNNAWDKIVTFVEKETDLQIQSITLPQKPYVNRTVKVIASIINNGQTTSQPIKAILNTSKEGSIQNITKNDGLQRNKVYNFSFNWVPKYFGSQTLSVKIIYDNKIQNTIDQPVFVNYSRLSWWNSSWHYRYFLIVDGKGIISKNFDFTDLLNSLGVYSQVFEDETIRIVEYKTNGDILQIINNYKFNKSTSYDPLTNANGTLIWDATSSISEKYYCVYFDVETNPGIRTGLTENSSITKSGNAKYSGFVEGWWAEVKQPVNGSYCFINTSKGISVVTSAKADSATAEFIFNKSVIGTLNLTSNIDSTIWSCGYTFSGHKGNWTIKITSSDAAGYSTTASNDIYVGKPDLRIVNLSFSTNWAPTSPKIYKNDTVNITACVISYYANIENVAVSLFINNYKNITVPVVLKDENNYVSFTWRPNKTGVYNINITVDPENIIDESNESNNRIIKTVTVYGWPDLEVESIILPTGNITEQSKVGIDVVIANKGEGDAFGYEVGLYIESARESTMTYTNKKSYDLVNVSLNEREKISLFWDPAESGEWKIGIMILVSDAKKDLNISNNRRVSIETLIVRGFERNKPVILGFDIEPDSQEQGGVVKILAEITDDSGLDSVTIIIASPEGAITNGVMSRTHDDWFRYDFKETSEPGEYTFVVKAVDLSYYANTVTAEGSFIIKKDSTYPVIHFFDVNPSVQLKGELVEISCIATDNFGIKKVTVNIIPPDDVAFDKKMALSSDGIYVYKDIYDVSGMYTFNIAVEDMAGKITTTENKTFWITSNLNDTDDDGMPDSWEKKHGLNPRDPSDADKDPDGDGYTNLEEYKMGTNPSKDIFLENAAYRIKENGWYLTSSILLFLFILLLSIYGIRRKKS